jgi:hypothetical protein
MNTGGWIIMILSVGTVSLLFGWCIWKVLKTPGEASHMHGFELETPDEKQSHRSS